tara:strand:+ start:149 stop:865 length:717 start_codon:yes stop_codon:yes gene_type:complete
MYNILCAGCSFTKCERLPTGNTFGGYSYANHLPEFVYNIGEAGAGITKHLIEKFVQENKDIDLTHFIYQVPSPARQPLDINENAPECFHIREAVEDERKIIHGYKNSILNKKNIWNLLIENKILRSKHITEIFTNHEKYLDKAMNNVDINVKFIRENYPGIKIIFLRYEITTIPLLSAFCKDWYKNNLSEYCMKNDITYIYEEDFNSKWFNKNGMTTDQTHPDGEGVKIIADKIKIYI